METYRKVFFWIFLMLGALFGLCNQLHIDEFLMDFTSFVGDKLDRDILKKELTKQSDSLGQMVVKLVLYIIVAILTIIVLILLGVVYGFLLAIVYLINKIYVTYVLFGILFIYPFYFIFINLFELFLLLMIQHPSKRVIRRVIGRGKIDQATIDSISSKMTAYSGRLPHEIESQIMKKQLDGISRLIYAEIAGLRKLREARIREALAAYD
ncbi:MAG: hypothetical protein GF353_18170 [Candidatus Lokiarchaeota archaeon]|nr:hypothetical protein [Candidatus Lokiarchaeota archaeon]